MRDVRLTVVLNRIERVALDSYCRANSIKKSELIRKVLINFLYLPAYEQVAILQRARALAPAGRRGRPSAKLETLSLEPSRADNGNPGAPAKGTNPRGTSSWNAPLP